MTGASGPTTSESTVENKWLRLSKSSLGWYGSLIGIAWVISVPLFVRLTSASVHTDIMDHARLAKTVVEGGGWISYSFWYPLLYLLSGGANSITVMRLVSIGLLSILVAGKAVLVFWIARKTLGSSEFAFLTSLCVMVVMPLIDPARPMSIYLGQISANVWHNSTNILAAPFAIAAFFSGIHLLRFLSLKNAAYFSGLMVLSILAKPNFSLAFLPVFGIAVVLLLWRKHRGLWESLLLVLIAFLPAGLVLAYQYLVVYVDPSVITAKPTFAPFVVWSAFSPNIALSIVLSLVGPALVFIALPKERRRSLPIVMGWVTLLVSIIQLSLLGEGRTDGGIALSGNWFWGSYTVATIVFIISIVELLRQIRSSEVRTSAQTLVMYVAALAICGHVASGIYYVLNIGVGHYANY